MRHFLISAAALLLVSCAADGRASGARAMPMREGLVELKRAPVTLTLDLGRERAHLLAVAKDPARHLVLRIEEISVAGEVGLWEVRVGDRLAGTLSTYGAEASQGKYVAAVVMDEAAEPGLRGGAKSLAVTFVPAGEAAGTIRFRRLRLVVE